MYKVICEKKELDEFKRVALLRLCRNHFIKNSASDVNRHMSYPATNVAKEGIALLVAARDLQTFDSIFNGLMIVMLSKNCSPEIMKHYETQERLANGFAEGLCVRPCDTETSEGQAIPTVSTLKEDSKPDLFKGRPFFGPIFALSLKLWPCALNTTMTNIHRTVSINRTLLRISLLTSSLNCLPCGLMRCHYKVFQMRQRPTLPWRSGLT